MNLLRWSSIAPPGGMYHVARATYAPGPLLQPHTHDFAEVFWVESGPGLHWVNGERRRLDPGDLVLIRPTDAHVFAGRTGSPLTLVNVAFKPACLVSLRRRYAAELTPWPWRGGALPIRWQIGQTAIMELNQWATAASMSHQSALELDWFLMMVLRLGGTKPPIGHPREQYLPEWLHRAIHLFSDPKHLCQGVAGLAHLSNKTPEHVNRVVRRHLGQRAAQLTNQLRMEYAARELRMTNRPILDIMQDAGLSNVGYFYRNFRKQFGLPPRKYRLREQKLIR